MRETAYFDIKDMHCPDCKTKIEKAVFCYAGCQGCRRSFGR